METLKDKIKVFLNYNSSYNWAFNSGFGRGDGSGHGFDSSRSTNCCSGWGWGYGSGSGEGNGLNYGRGWGYGFGSGDGNCRGRGDKFILDYDSFGYKCGIKEINGETVYIIDGLQTIIKSVHGNIARGFILQDDLTLEPCYIFKEQNKFAHGSTLHEAFNALQEKLYDNSTEEERIEAFHKKFPEYNVPYSNRDLFTYHHILTGSCHMGRESFCKDMGIDLDGSTTVRKFILLTKNSYGSDIICKLPKAYGINE